VGTASPNPHRNITSSSVLTAEKAGNVAPAPPSGLGGHTQRCTMRNPGEVGTGTLLTALPTVVLDKLIAAVCVFQWLLLPKFNDYNFNENEA
jgi:hypothetical protein